MSPVQLTHFRVMVFAPLSPHRPTLSSRNMVQSSKAASIPPPEGMMRSTYMLGTLGFGYSAWAVFLAGLAAIHGALYASNDLRIVSVCVSTMLERCCRDGQSVASVEHMIRGVVLPHIHTIRTAMTLDNVPSDATQVLDMPKGCTHCVSCIFGPPTKQPV